MTFEGHKSLTKLSLKEHETCLRNPRGLRYCSDSFDMQNWNSFFPFLQAVIFVIIRSGLLFWNPPSPLSFLCSSPVLNRFFILLFHNASNLFDFFRSLFWAVFERSHCSEPDWSSLAGFLKKKKMFWIQILEGTKPPEDQMRSKHVNMSLG